jgi:hypothetical protein
MLLVFIPILAISTIWFISMFIVIIRRWWSAVFSLHTFMILKLFN